MSENGDGSVQLVVSGRFVRRIAADGSGPVTVVDAGFADDVTALEVGAADDTIVVTGYASGKVRMWVDGVSALDFQPHDSAVKEISMAVVDGVPTLATRDSSGTVVTRDLSPTGIREELCAVADRDLTAAEWRSVGGVGAPPTCRRGLD